MLTKQVDQPSLALPREFYLDQDTYAEQVAAYKTFIGGVADVMIRELGSDVTQTELNQRVEDLFNFEYRLAVVCFREKDLRMFFFLIHRSFRVSCPLPSDETRLRCTTP